MPSVDIRSSRNSVGIPPPSPPKDSWGGLPLDGAMEAVAQEIAERLRPAPFVRVVTHIDTDGITGGAIASEALDRSGIAHEVAFVKKLDEAIITDLKRQASARSATSRIRNSGVSPVTIGRSWRTGSPPAFWRRTSISDSTDERRGPRTRCSSMRRTPGFRG